MKTVMKLGDLRRFKDNVRNSAEILTGLPFAGRTFMVLEMETNGPICSVSFLIDDRIERGWGGHWVERSSEVFDGVS